MKRNESICFDFPNSTSLCDYSPSKFLHFVVCTKCIIPLNSHNANLTNFNCRKDCAKFEFVYNSSTHKTCLSNFEDDANGTVVFFACAKSLTMFYYTYSYEIEIGKNLNY